MSGAVPGRWTRQALLILLLVLFVALVASRFTDLANLIAVLSTAGWGWIVVALLTHAAYFVVYACMYQYAFAILGVASEVRRLLTLFFASLFVNAVAPLGGAGGAALFIDDSVRRGYPWARTAAAVLLVLIVDLATSLPFIVIGLFYLARIGKLALYDVVGAALYSFVVFCLVSALAISLLSERWVSRILGQLRLWANGLGRMVSRPEVVSAAWIDQTSRQFGGAARALASQPSQIFLMLVLGTVLTLMNLAGLYALFLAFGERPPLGVAVAGFGLSVVYFVISVFTGAGVVEYIMTLVFVSAGIPPAQAITVALCYRGLNFWMPLLLGLFFVGRAPTFRSAG